jgi:hypothetical protein
MFRASILSLSVLAALSASSVLATAQAQEGPVQATTPATAAQPKNQAVMQAILSEVMQGQTELAELTPSLRLNIDQQVGMMAGLVARINAFGPLQTVTFIGTEHGLEIYEARFEKATMGWALGVNADGKVAMLRWKFR